MCTTSRTPGNSVGRLTEPGFSSEQHRGRAIDHSELVEDDRHVVAHGLRRQAERPRDLLVALAVGDPFEHFPFARRQRGERAGAGITRRTDETNETPRYASSEHDAAGGTGCDGASQLVPVGALGEVTTGARGDCRG